MKNGEWLTAPAGAVSSILAITVPNMDDVEATVLLISAIVCTVRTVWLSAIKPAIIKIRDAWRAYKERKGRDNDSME